MELDSKEEATRTPSPGRHKLPLTVFTSPSNSYVVGSPKEQELSTSLSNLKWGFKRREEKLLEQLAVHKEALTELYQLHINLKDKLNDAGTATCAHLEVAESVVELQEETEERNIQQQLYIATLKSKLATLEKEKNTLEAINYALQSQLLELQNTITSSTGNSEASSLPDSQISNLAEPETTTNPTTSSIASVVQTAYPFTETTKPTEANAKEDAGLTEFKSSKKGTGKVSSVGLSPVRTNKRAAAENRRHSSDSALQPPKLSNKAEIATDAPTTNKATASGGRRSSFPKKGTTPKQEPPAVKLTKSPVKQNTKPETKPETKPFLQRKLPVSDINTTSQPDTTDTNVSLVKEKDTPPRVSLRQRMEEHAQLRSREHNLNHNAWVGGFTKTNRASGGGMQFFVDVLTPAPRNNGTSANMDGADGVDGVDDFTGDDAVDNFTLVREEAKDELFLPVITTDVSDVNNDHLHTTIDSSEVSSTDSTVVTDRNAIEVAPIVLTLQPPTEIPISTAYTKSLLNTRNSAHSLSELQLLQSELNTASPELSILHTPVPPVEAEYIDANEEVVLDSGDYVETSECISDTAVLVKVDSNVNISGAASEDKQHTNQDVTTAGLFIDTTLAASDTAPVSPAPSSSNKYLLLEVQIYKRQVLELKKQLSEIEQPTVVEEKKERKVSNVATQVTEASLFVLETPPHITAADRSTVTSITTQSLVNNDASIGMSVPVPNLTPVRILQGLAAQAPVTDSFPTTANLVEESIDLNAALQTTPVKNLDQENAENVDDMDMFVELCDVSVQCTPTVSTTDAACNTDTIPVASMPTVPPSAVSAHSDVSSLSIPASREVSTQSEFANPVKTVIATSNQSTATIPNTVSTSTSTNPLPTTTHAGTTVCLPNTRDEILIAAIEKSKFDVGKKLFKLRMEERKLTKLHRTQRDTLKPSTTTTSTTALVLSSTLHSNSVTTNIATINTAAVNRSNEQAKLNAELITSLQEKSTRHLRDQQKIELLEQKLCRLIMYVKRSNKLNDNSTATNYNDTAGNNDIATTNAVQTCVATTSLPSKPGKPTQRLSPVPNKPTQKSVKVGEMSFHGDLSHLLCIDNNSSNSSGTSSDEENEHVLDTSVNISDVTDIFSPPRDFEGRYYNETSELNVTSRSNPLLHQTITSPQPSAHTSNNKHTKNDCSVGYKDVYQDVNNSIVDISFGNTSAFDMPQMASLGNNNNDLFSPIPRKSVYHNNRTAITDKNGTEITNAQGTKNDFQAESTASQSTIHKLQQQAEFLETRNKSLLRDKELLLNKLKRTFETDTASFGLKIYSADHNQTYALDNPTVTTSIVMGFIDNNNKLLEKIGVMTSQLEEKMHQGEKQAQLSAEANAELTQALSRNRDLHAEVSSLNAVVLNVTQDRDNLQKQVSQLTGTLVHMAQENKLLKERMKMHSF